MPTLASPTPNLTQVFEIASALRRLEVSWPTLALTLTLILTPTLALFLLALP